ncbi:NAD(P)-binding domain-containing protein [Amycolatopsis sp. NPDC005232]|uniref:NAD(P)-binding domain-containing protein n=1 Tax=Amycolatopsis sp. NPDC005232 TaxID=3157027 RepID=UPI00339EEEFB
MRAYGFVGAGEITAAIVEGLSADVADPPAVFLSPRGRQVAHELAGRFPNVAVCASNQEVLDVASVIVLAVRPDVAREVVAELEFRPDHVVLSAVAGVPLATLREWTAPAAPVVRTIPLPQAARRQSLTAVFPDHPVARGLFEPLGGVVVPPDEPTLDAFSAATATFAAHLDYLATIAGWLAGHGVEPGAADAYVTHLFAQLGQSLDTASLTVLTAKHTTPGGINQQLMTALRHDGVPGSVRRGLDAVLARLRE